MSKRDRPTNFFDEEDEDLDYLIQASIDHDKENEFISFEDYMNQEPTAPKPGNVETLFFAIIIVLTQLL
jgi:U3 small nucleolar ribonucleoprotein component